MLSTLREQLEEGLLLVSNTKSLMALLDEFAIENLVLNFKNGF